MKTMRCSSTTLFHATALVIALFSTSVARADAPKAEQAPRASSRVRAREVKLETYEAPVEIVRSKTRGMKVAAFGAEPQVVEPTSVILFEIRSVSTRGSVDRWRCIAVENVSECFPNAVRLSYLPGDQRMILTVTAKPRTADILQAAAEAHPASLFAAN